MKKERWFVKWAVWVNERTFIKIFQQTMIVLFPIVLVGSFTWVISTNLLATNGFLANIFRVHQLLPQTHFWRQLFRDATLVTVGLISPYAAFMSANLTTHYYHRPNTIAGLTAVISYILIFFHNFRGRQTIDMRYYNAGWLIIAILLGYVVGRIFTKWGHEFKIADIYLSSPQLMKRSLSNLRLFALIFSGVFLLHIGYALLRTFNLDATATQVLSSLISQNSNYLLNISLSFINTLIVWLGFGEPISLSASAYSNEISSNLTYALTHKTLINVPYPFTPSSLYNGFANFGGIGVTLALVIGILWIGKQKDQQKIAGWSAFPAIFNTGMPILFGARVFLNPVFLLPFIFLPVFNMLVASVLIFIHAIPPIVYPVPNGTPGILIPFIVTGGDWRALVVSICLLIIDVAVYIPFIKLALEVEEKVSKKEGRQDD